MYHMGVTAENVAERFEMSHRRAVAAIVGGRFDGRITAASVPQRRGDPVSADTDGAPAPTLPIYTPPFPLSTPPFPRKRESTDQQRHPRESGDKSAARNQA